MIPFDEFLKNKGAQKATTTPTVDTSAAIKSFNEFRNTKIPQTTTPIKDVSSAINSFNNFKNAKLQGIEPPVVAPVEKKGTIAGNTLRWAGKELMKPVGVLATVAEQTGKTMGSGDLRELAKIPLYSAEVLAGQRERSFSDIWREGLSEHPVAGTIIGTVIDMTADPLNFVSGGLTKAGELAELASKIKKSGGIIEEGSKLANKIEKAGMTAKDLELAATKAEQAAKGQRSFLKFADTPLLPKEASETLYKLTGKTGKAIKSIPVVGSTLEKGKNAINAVVEKGRDVFKTTTGNKEADLVIQHFKNMGEYLKAKSIENAIQIQKDLAKYSKPEEIIQVSNYLEKGIKPLNPKLQEIGDRLKNIYDTFFESEKKAGINVNKRSFYAPHINVPEKGKTLDFLNTRKYSTSLGAAEARDVMKFVGEDGKTIIGTPKGLNLTEIENVTTPLQPKNLFNLSNAELTGRVFKDEFGKTYKLATGKNALSIKEANEYFKVKMGKNLFEENPAIQLGYRGVANAKATSSAELFNNMKQFAIKDGIEVGIPELKGLKFEPGVAKQLDAYYKAIQPEELKTIVKMFDGVQNWWKAQALISPAYHTRNMIGNLWNNFLAGVTNPNRYVEAGKIQKGKSFNMVDDIGRKWNEKSIMDAAEKSGVINQGQYISDIPTTIESAIKKGNYNPFSQENKLFRANKAIGGGIENNARLANFIEQLKKGLPIDEAAMEVKKFLFDYQDLTWAERNILKRIMPFYTFTRKNLPLQLENLMKQPGKYAGLEKAVRAFEDIGMGNSSPANEKYLSDYIKSNTAMRVNYNPKDQTYNYFLLGNWMPSYQAMDFISQPTQNLIGMLTPIAKTPMELLMNKSTFWKNSLDEYQNLERYPGEQTSFLGLNMTKKTAQFLRNIRILNDLDKLNPGLIFGGKRGQKSIFAKAKVPAVSVPLFGNVSPSQYKYSAQGVNPTGGERLAGFLSGKLTSYKPSSAREYYNQDTDARVIEMQTAIKRAAATGDNARVKLLTDQLNKFRTARGD